MKKKCKIIKKIIMFSLLIFTLFGVSSCTIFIDGNSNQPSSNSRDTLLPYSSSADKSSRSDSSSSASSSSSSSQSNVEVKKEKESTGEIKADSEIIAKESDKLCVAESTTEINNLVKNSVEDDIVLTSSQYETLKSKNGADSVMLFSNSNNEVVKYGVLDKNSSGENILRDAKIDEIFSELKYDVSEKKINTTSSANDVRLLSDTSGEVLINKTFTKTFEKDFKIDNFTFDTSMNLNFNIEITNFSFDISFNIWDGLDYSLYFDYDISGIFDSAFVFEWETQLKKTEKEKLDSIKDSTSNKTKDHHKIEKWLLCSYLNNKASVLDGASVRYNRKREAGVEGIEDRSVQFEIGHIPLPYLEVLGKASPIRLPIIMYLDAKGNVSITATNTFELIEKGSFDYDTKREVVNQSVSRVNEIYDTFGVEGALSAIFQAGVALQLELVQLPLVEVTFYFEDVLKLNAKVLLHFDLIKGNQILYVDGYISHYGSVNIDINLRFNIKVLFIDFKIEKGISVVRIKLWEQKKELFSYMLVMHDYNPITKDEYIKYGVNFNKFYEHTGYYNLYISDEGNIIDKDNLVSPTVTDITFDNSNPIYENKKVEFQVKLNNPDGFKVDSITYRFNNATVVKNTDDFLIGTNEEQLIFNVTMPANVTYNLASYKFEIVNINVSIYDLNKTITSDLSNNINVIDLGDGSINNPYKIYETKHILDLKSTNSNCILMIDLDMNDIPYWQGLESYDSVFDGNNHTISNLTINDRKEASMFGYLTENAVVKNVNFDNCVTYASEISKNPNGAESSASILATNNYGKISNVNFTNCAAKSDLFSSLVACKNNGTIEKVEINQAIVLSKYSYSGIVTGLNGSNGVIDRVNVKDSNLYAEGNYIGGIVGENDGLVKQCTISNSEITGSYYVGGISGYNKSFSTNSSDYSLETVVVTNIVISGEDCVGGIVGRNAGRIVNYNFEQLTINCETTNQGNICGKTEKGSSY